MTMREWTPDLLRRAYDAAERLIGHGGGRDAVEAKSGGYYYRAGVYYPLTDEDLTALLLTDGAGGADHPPARVTLIGYSDYDGSDLDAANVRTLAGEDDEVLRISTGGYHGGGSAWWQIGELPPGDDLDDAISRLERVADMLDSLADYPLLDEEEHSRYVDELADEAWDQWLRCDVLDSVDGMIAAATGVEDDSDDDGNPLHEVTPLTEKYAGDPRDREDLIRDAYYSFEENEWVCESATSATNYRDEDARRHVLAVVFGLDTVDCSAERCRRPAERDGLCDRCHARRSVGA